MWNAWRGGDDDEGEKKINNVSDIVRQNKGVFFYGSGPNDYVAVNTSFSLGFAKYAGEQITSMMQGDVTPMEAAVSVANAFRQMAMPIKGSADKDWLTTIKSIAQPSAVRPFVEAEANVSSFGSRIYKENKYSTKPRSEMGREDTPAIWKWLARGANSLSGGTDTVSGGLSRQPEWYEYLAKQLGGGLFTFGSDVLEGKMPSMGGIMGKGGEYASMNNYYEHTKNMDQMYETYLDAELDDNPAQYNENRKKFPVQTDPDVMEAYGDASENLKQINQDYRDGVYASVDEYYADMNKEYKEFNRVYNEAKKKYEGR